jgi:PAS domain S-box-containing protein
MKDSIFDFEGRIAEAYHRLETLSERTGGLETSEQVVAREALEALSNTLEELHVATEELRQQGDELADSYQILEAERRRYQELFEFAPDGYLVTDDKGVIREANRAAAALLGVAQNYLMGKPLVLFVEQMDRPIFYAHLQQVSAPEKSQEWELRLSPREEASLPAAVTLAASRDAANETTSLRWLLRDISARKQAEQALQESKARIQQQEKLAVVGQLAAGIAHDFNNLLTAMMGMAEIVLLEPNLNPQTRADLRTIIQQGERGAHLVKQILDFSRKSLRYQRPLELAAFLRQLCPRLERELFWVIPAILDAPPGEYLVKADRAQIEQVIFNLAENAQDAMPGGGQFTIRLGKMALAPGEAPLLPDMPSGQWIAITVSDTGCGIPPEVMPHLFEPFFTTKPPGRASGLGLAQVYGIIKQHDGFIGVQSQVGVGTSWTIYLPDSQSPAAETPPSVPEPHIGRWS